MTISKPKQQLFVVAALLLWCVGLIALRIHLAADGLAVGLLWNLFLASVPLFWGAGFQSAMERKSPLWAALCFGLWLLFLPNAPYLLTDLIHLAPHPPVPFWFLLAMLLSCAGAGTLLGYLSLAVVHRVVAGNFGKAMGWIMASGSLLLCGFGIYVGRFLRWNSWDLVTRPVTLLRALAHQFVDAGPYPHPIPVTLVFGGGLLLGYLALHVVAGAMRSAD